MLLGIHCSVRPGYAAALAEARALGVEAMQILPYRRHHLPGDAELAAFCAARARSSVRRLLVHSRFLPALASDDAARRRGSVRHLERELGYARRLGADAFVLHMGAYPPGADFERGLDLFCASLREAAPAGALPLLIENVPGGGRRMGGTLAELGRILERVRAVWPRAGACVDTAHAWAGGELAGGAADFLARVRDRLGEADAWHLNDSLAEPGSCRESHWHLGQGRLAPVLPDLLAALARTDAIVILETPKEGDADARNLAWARGLRAGG